MINMSIIQKLIALGADMSTKKAMKAALGTLGLHPENIDKLYIELKNSIHADAFKKAPKSKKIVFLPQCLRDCDNCKAKLDKFGYNCVKCSDKCYARKVKEMAEKKGYRVFIVPGGSMIAKVIKEFNPKAVLGVACKGELVMAFDQLSIPAQGVELLKDGCVNTVVDPDEVEKLL